MYLRKITLFTLVSVALLICSVSTVNADNHTIYANDEGGIAQGIINTGTGNTLFLQPGIYNKTNLDTNITINKSITMKGNGSKDSVIINAQNLSRIFIINNNINVNFINITFINGNGSQNYSVDGFWIYDGGAIANGFDNSTLTFIDCIFTNNHAKQYGGAIYNRGPYLSIINSSFIDNNALSGGAVYNYGYNFTIENSDFTNNIATEVGGAIVNHDNNFTVSNSNFTNNNATYSGGAILTTNPTNIILINSNFINNNAKNHAGGALSTSNQNHNLDIINCTFINNTAGNYGGAVYWNYGDNVNIINSTFTSNNAFLGGAIYSNIGNDFTVTNSNFTNNSASYGGAIYFFVGYDFTVINSNFTNNSASYGGAIYSADNMDNCNIINSTFIGNNATGIGGGIFNFGNMSVSGNTMVDNIAGIFGNVIYNAGNMGVFNLTYLGNSTLKVLNNTYIFINATLTDDMGNPITGGGIEFYVNDGFLGSILSIEGNAGMFYIPNTLGILPVTGKYSSKGLYSIDINSGQLEVVIKFDTGSTIVIPDNVIVGKTINITGLATDEFENPLANIYINVTVDGKNDTVLTDDNGKWILSYKPTYVGNILISVIWEGNDIYYGFTNTRNFNVEKGNIIVIITVIENDDGSITIIANATDEDRDPVINRPVDFVLNGEIVGSGITDENGIATITVPAGKITVGLHKITVTVFGGDNFNDGIASAEFIKTSNDNEMDSNPSTPNDDSEVGANIPNDDENNVISEDSSNSNTTKVVAMKKTGIPVIIILIVLLSSLRLIIRKNQ
ncbi:MAG: hypothetical protein FWE58_03745 [Methanobrevibacter sp.]|nr:hypothetical protein [Methanobrevibacter sp.]